MRCRAGRRRAPRARARSFSPSPGAAKSNSAGSEFCTPARHPAPGRHPAVPVMCQGGHPRPTTGQPRPADRPVAARWLSAARLLASAPSSDRSFSSSAVPAKSDDSGSEFHLRLLPWPELVRSALRGLSSLRDRLFSTSAGAARSNNSGSELHPRPPPTTGGCRRCATWPARFMTTSPRSPAALILVSPPPGSGPFFISTRTAKSNNSGSESHLRLPQRPGDIRAALRRLPSIPQPLAFDFSPDRQVQQRRFRVSPPAPPPNRRLSAAHPVAFPLPRRGPQVVCEAHPGLPAPSQPLVFHFGRGGQVKQRRFDHPAPPAT